MRVVVAVLLALAGCRDRGPSKPPPPRPVPETEARQPCVWNGSAREELCREGRPEVAPVVLPGGRLRMVFAGPPDGIAVPPGLTEERADATYFVVDVTPSGQELIATTDCPVVASALGADGEFYVVCGEQQIEPGPHPRRWETVSVRIQKLTDGALSDWRESIQLRRQPPDPEEIDFDGIDLDTLVLLVGDEEPMLVYREVADIHDVKEWYDVWSEPYLARWTAPAAPVALYGEKDHLALGSAPLWDHWRGGDVPTEDRRVVFYARSGRTYAAFLVARDDGELDRRVLEVTAGKPRWLDPIELARTRLGCPELEAVVAVQSRRGLEVHVPALETSPDGDLEDVTLGATLDGAQLPSPTILGDGLGDCLDEEWLGSTWERTSCTGEVCVIADAGSSYWPEHATFRVRRVPRAPR